MSKKKGEYSVLVEVNTEDEWVSLCEKEGLTVVDVYCEWSGPCSAMTSFLKKVKLEINDDLLSYAMAKVDAIPQLKAFQGHCKPVWLFMASGHPVAVVHGANAPLLGRMIHNEMFKERMALSGEMERRVIALEEAVPRRAIGERSRISVSEVDGGGGGGGVDEDNFDGAMLPEDSHNVIQCLQELKQVDNDKEEERRNFALLLVEEYIAEEEECVSAVLSKLRDVGMTVMRRKTSALSQEDVALFSSGSGLRAEHVTPLIGTNCLILLVRCDESQNAIAQLEDLVGPVAVDDDEQVVPPSDARFFRQRFYDEEEFCVGFLVPNYGGFLALMDKFFVEGLKKQYQRNKEEEEKEGHLLLIFEPCERIKRLSYFLEDGGLDTLHLKEDVTLGQDEARRTASMIRESADDDDDDEEEEEEVFGKGEVGVSNDREKKADALEGSNSAKETDKEAKLGESSESKNEKDDDDQRSEEEEEDDKKEEEEQAEEEEEEEEEAMKLMSKKDLLLALTTEESEIKLVGRPLIFVLLNHKSALPVSLSSQAAAEEGVPALLAATRCAALIAAVFPDTAATSVTPAAAPAAAAAHESDDGGGGDGRDQSDGGGREGQQQESDSQPA